MSTNRLTLEQEKVVHHPLGFHARILAVAGSGKSTNMAYRIKYLVQECQVRPSAIQVLMFNALARKQFRATLDKIDMAQNFQPEVHTFHSYSFHLINQMVKEGLLPSSTQFWLGDKEELVWLTVKRAITNLEKAKRVPPEAIDSEEALHAISLWKGSLIPPERAGSFTSPYLPLVYAQFEQQRLSEIAYTFDDFIPTAIEILLQNPQVHRRWCLGLQHLIVDEYQDINLAQQRLIEILAGSQADVMVVGDESQTIFEWRGARPAYIIHDFSRVFSSKPVMDYQLSRSFRFGPLIAQCSANVIACNTNRVDKALVASQAGKSGFIHIYSGGYSSTKELAEQVIALVQVDKVPPKQIIVLARMFAQLDNLEAEFLMRGIPYRVDGQEPFFKRREINTLLDYIRLAYKFYLPITDQVSGWLLSIANKPSRMLSRSLLSQLLSKAKFQKMTMLQLFETASKGYPFGLNAWQVLKISDLYSFLEELISKLNEPNPLAGPILAWMVETLDYLKFFQNYYGKGEHADEKAFAVTNFIKHVTQLHISPEKLPHHMEELDTTQGKPEEELIVFTTIFRTKGLEFEYVVLPQCDEGLFPYLKGEHTDVYDTQGQANESSMSTALENERRLFYVAITRAKRGVLIGTSGLPSRFLYELDLEGTEDVMNAVQGLAEGNPDAKDFLLQQLLSGSLKPSISQNLISGYLPDMGQVDLLRQLEREYVLPGIPHEVEAIKGGLD